MGIGRTRTFERTRSRFSAGWTSCAAAALLLATIAGCGRTGASRTGGDTTAHAGPETTATSPASEAAWNLDFAGYGPVRTGMTVAELEGALGIRYKLPGNPEPCFYLSDTHHPGVAFMIVDMHLARIDARDSTVRTVEGAGIGDDEARIESLFPGRVDVQPHKYVNGGHYLIVRPPADAETTKRLIFETDGGRVTLFRTGRLPEVRWVEGCS